MIAGLDPDLLITTPDPVSWFDTAQAHFAAGAFAEAEAAYRAIIAAQPGHIEAHIGAARALLAELLKRATVPDKVYSHDWSVGDTVIWDNRGVLHRAAPYDPSSAREMLRTTVLGGQILKDWGLHLVDADMTMGNLIDVVGDESKAYLAQAGK